MGYKPFNKTTIQLPLPASTLTKAQYKEAYGIDLDDIDFPKVTLLVDGNEKYHVDEIKIVSDDVLILGGGKVLTIGDDGNVSVTSDAYSVENAKPIYWHGISLTNPGQSIDMQAHILNNSDESINSVAKLDAWFKSISGRVILSCNGVIVVSGVGYTAYAISKETDNTYKVFYVTATGYSYEAFSTLASIFTSVNDAKNKIN